jgi:hypothetical protein
MTTQPDDRGGTLLGACIGIGMIAGAVLSHALDWPPYKFWGYAAGAGAGFVAGHIILRLRG